MYLNERKIIGVSSGNYIIEKKFFGDREGVSIRDSSGNYIYHNIFLGTRGNADDDSVNSWDNGYPSGGNYWNDYEGTDSDHDGIGDSPYDVPGGDNQDRYPLFWAPGIPRAGITSPVEGFLYLRNQKKIPFIATVIIGKIDVTVNASEPQDGIDRVEFYLSNDLQETDFEAPYTWTWERGELLRHRWRIKVIAYDADGDSFQDEINVWRFL